MTLVNSDVQIFNLRLYKDDKLSENELKLKSRFSNFFMLPRHFVLTKNYAAEEFRLFLGMGSDSS